LSLCHVTSHRRYHYQARCSGKQNAPLRILIFDPDSSASILTCEQHNKQQARCCKSRLQKLWSLILALFDPLPITPKPLPITSKPLPITSKPLPKSSKMLIIKTAATLTVAAANLSVYVCIILLYQLTQCREESGCLGGENTKYVLALICTSILCLLVLVTATLDNVSWWSGSFPDAFMSTDSLTQFFYRLSVAEPGLKVTIQQDYFLAEEEGGKTNPRTRRKSVEMFKSKQWVDGSASLAIGETFSGRVVKVRLEVGPVDRVAKEDINKFLREMVEESSSPGSYDRRTLTGVTVEARLPQLPLFQGPKAPHFSVEKKSDCIALPLGSKFHKIQGDPVRIFVFRNSCLCRNFFPALFSFKKILFLVVLLLPVLGTALSLILADNTTQVVFKKRYSRRATLEEQLLEGTNSSAAIRIGLPRITLRPRLPQDPVSFDTFGGVTATCATNAGNPLFAREGVNERKQSEAVQPLPAPPQLLATICEAEIDLLVSESGAVPVSEPSAVSSSSSPSSSLSELDPLLPPFPTSRPPSNPSIASRPGSRTHLLSPSPTTATVSSSNSSSTPIGDSCLRDHQYLPPSTPSSLPPSYSSPSFSSSSPPCYTKALETALDLGQLRSLHRETHLL